MKKNWIEKIIFILLLVSINGEATEFFDYSELLSKKYWNEKISLGGVIDVAGYASNHTPTTIGTIPKKLGSPPASDLIIPYANLHVTAPLSDWITASLVYSYAQRSKSFVRNPPGGGDVFFTDVAEIIFANPELTHFYAQLGRHFLIFGGIDSTSYLESPFQLIGLSRHTTFTVGFKDFNGFSSSIYLFRSQEPFHDYIRNRTQANNFGVSFDYEYESLCQEIGYQFGVGYLSNITGSLYISTTRSHKSHLYKGYYEHVVPGLDLHAKCNYGIFDFYTNFIGALRSFNVKDLAFTENRGRTFRGAKPLGWGINTGMTFHVCDYESRLGIGYQGSSEAVALGTTEGSVASPISGVYGPYFAIGIPRMRFYSNYAVHINFNFDLFFEVAHDTGYKKNNGGTGRSAIIGVFAVRARFGD